MVQFGGGFLFVWQKWLILFCRRIVLINILLSFFQTILSSSFIFLLILHKISSFSLNNTELCKNYSKKPLSCPRVLYSSFDMFWGALTVHRNSFRFVFQKCGCSQGGESWTWWKNPIVYITNIMRTTYF